MSVTPGWKGGRGIDGQLKWRGVWGAQRKTRSCVSPGGQGNGIDLWWFGSICKSDKRKQ